eukprot:tig00021493_g21859.t1
MASRRDAAGQAAQHPVFSKIRAPRIDSSSTNLAAVSGDWVYTYGDDGDNGTALYCADIKRLNSRSVETIRLEPPPDFQVLQLLLNSTGEYAAFVGERQIYVGFVKRPHGAARPHKSGASEPSFCRTVPLGEEYLEAAIVQAAWHPLSESHLAVLSDDGLLRLFDLSRDLYEPEQTISARAVGGQPDGGEEEGPEEIEGDRVVAFEFGAARGWEAFALYFLYASGDLRALCPVVPYGGRVPVSLLTGLCDGLREGVGAAPAGSLPRQVRWQLHWLAEIAGALPASRSAAPRRLRAGGARVRAGGADETADLSLEALRALFLAAAKRPRPAAPARPRAPLGAPHGPFAYERLNPAPALEEGAYVALARVGAGPPALACATREGRLRLLVALEELAPRWLDDVRPAPPRPAPPPPKLTPAQRDAAAEEEAPPPALLLVETLELPCPSPALFPDPTYRERVYVRHGRGVHCVQLPWLAALQAFLRDAEAGAPGRLPELPPALPFPLLHTARPGPLPAALVLSDPVAGYMLLAVTREGRPLGVPLASTLATWAPAPQLALAPLPLPLPAPAPAPAPARRAQPRRRAGRRGAGGPRGAVPPLSRLLEPLLSPQRRAARRAAALAPPQPPPPPGRDGRDAGVAAEVRGAMKEGYVVDLTRVCEETLGRLELLEGVEVHQNGQLEALHARLEGLDGRAERLEEAVRRASARQEQLAARAHAALRALTRARPPEASEAEKEWRGRLEQRREACGKFEERLNAVERRAGRAGLLFPRPAGNGAVPVALPVGSGGAEAGGGALSEQQMGRVKYVLEDEAGMVRENVAAVRRLHEALDALRL